MTKVLPSITAHAFVATVLVLLGVHVALWPLFRRRQQRRGNQRKRILNEKETKSSNAIDGIKTYDKDSAATNVDDDNEIETETETETETENDRSGGIETDSSTTTSKTTANEQVLVVYLDLDDCLIHYNQRARVKHVSSIESFDIPASSAQVFLRPGWKDLLRHVLSQHNRYQVHIFTASTKVYALPIISELERRLNDHGTHNHRYMKNDDNIRHAGRDRSYDDDDGDDDDDDDDDDNEKYKMKPRTNYAPDRHRLRFYKCWYRESCQPIKVLQATSSKSFAAAASEFRFVKNLVMTLPEESWWGSSGINSWQRRTVLVDNNAVNFARNPDQGIPVRSFRPTYKRGTKVFIHPQAHKDTALTKVKHLLHELSSLLPSGDVRPVLRENFGIAQLFRDADREPKIMPDKEGNTDLSFSRPILLDEQWEHVRKHVKSVEL